MERQTLDALNQLLVTMQNVGIAIVLALVIGLMVVAFILLTRRQSKADSVVGEQFRQAMTLLANAMNREDSETAKAMTPLIEIVSMVKISMDQNTQAFLRNDHHRAELLTATEKLATLQSENNAQVAALRIDVREWPKQALSAIERVDINILNVVNGFGNLDEKIRRILEAVESNPEDHRHVLEALANLAIAQNKIFTLIDSRLPANAKTITPSIPPLPPAPSSDLITLMRRSTDEFTLVRPEDKVIPLPPDDEPKEAG